MVSADSVARGRFVKATPASLTYIFLSPPVREPTCLGEGRDGLSLYGSSRDGLAVCQSMETKDDRRVGKGESVCSSTSSTTNITSLTPSSVSEPFTQNPNVLCEMRHTHTCDS